MAAISLFAAFGSGARTWTGFNSPDSEFYASLALFGDEVTDRAIDPAYTWTRLGYITPVRLLVTNLDPWVGFALWRLVLVTIFVASVYGIVRLASTRQLAVIVAVLASLNTVVLGFLGNTYLTGTIIVAMTLLLALGVWGSLGDPRRSWLATLLAGAVVGWLVMLNPYAMLLGLSMWLVPRSVRAAVDGAQRWRNLWRDAAVALGGFVVSFGTLLLSGEFTFPGRNWFETYVTWNSRLDYATFVGEPDAWQRDVALLVPVVAVLVSVVALVMVPRSRFSVSALGISVVNIAFTFAYLALVPGPWLEAPTYVAKLWPGALVAVALAFAAMVGRRDLGWPAWAVGAAGALLTLWAGRWDRDLAGAQGLLVVAVVVGLTAFAAVLLRRGSSPLAGVVIVAAIGAMAVGGQLLQNGRGLVGSYGQFPFRAAYVDFDAELLMRSKVAAEEFVLARTTKDDTVGIWTDSDRLTAGIAAMQLWGWYNNVSQGATLSAAEAQELGQRRPSALAMYAPTRDQVYAFWATLPPSSRPTPPDCTAVPFLGIGSPEAQVCVTRLDWTG